VRWVRLRWPEMRARVKDHVVPETLVDAVLLDLRSRYPLDTQPEWPREHVSEHWVDYGGMLAKDEPEISVAVDGLALRMKVHALLVLESACERMRYREAGGATFRKHHMWTSCLVVTPEQEDELHGVLARASREAEGLSVAYIVKLRERLAGAPNVVVDFSDPRRRPDPS
jgi:hypothetical protein